MTQPADALRYEAHLSSDVPRLMRLLTSAHPTIVYIAWLKVAFGIAVALDASLVAWLAQNYATASPIIVAVGLIAVLVIAVMIVLINRWAYRRIEELENV